MIWRQVIVYLDRVDANPFCLPGHLTFFAAKALPQVWIGGAEAGFDVWKYYVAAGSLWNIALAQLQQKGILWGHVDGADGHMKITLMLFEAAGHDIFQITWTAQVDLQPNRWWDKAGIFGSTVILSKWVGIHLLMSSTYDRFVKCWNEKETFKR